MIKNLHKWLILRLVLAWIVLSLVIGSIVQYLGNVRVDNHIMDMAKNEATGHTDALIAYLSAPSPPALSVLNSRLTAMLKNSNFIAIELYDAAAKKITEAFEPTAREVDKNLSEHDSGLADAKGIVCYKLMLWGETYLRVFAPINNINGANIGYLEGIYHVPGETISNIKRQTLWALVLVVLAILVTGLAMYPLIIRLNRALFDSSHNLMQSNIGLLAVLGSAIAKRDSDTNVHNYRVALYAVCLGEKMRLSDTAMQGLIKGAFLHDLGKIAISDAVLHKPAKLTYEEFEVMKTHVKHGEDIVSSYDWLKDALDVVKCHHEKYNGSGYPAGLKGEDIPLNARVFAVVDVFDALTSQRPYKDEFSFGTAVEIMRESLGSHFDPNVALIFLDNATVLYADICHGDEALLKECLGKSIRKYFSVGV